MSRLSLLFSPYTQATATTALALAMASVLFQQYDDFLLPTSQYSLICHLVMLAAFLVFWYVPWRRYAMVVFVGAFLATFFTDWSNAANHSWLALWALLPLMWLPMWHEEIGYRSYIRYTLAIAMLAAALQKIVAGTYVSGSYIAWMSFTGSHTEQALRWLCTESAREDSCLAFAAVGLLAIVWQLFVAVALFLNWQKYWIVCIEVAFLGFVGVYADELNFQVLNIALLCMAFQVGMSRYLGILLVLVLCLDVFTLDYLVSLLLPLLV